ATPSASLLHFFILNKCSILLNLKFPILSSKRRLRLQPEAASVLSLDVVGQRELQLVGALRHALDEWVGVAAAAAQVHDSVDAQQDVTRVPVDVGRLNLHGLIVDVLHVGIRGRQLAVEYPVDRGDEEKVVKLANPALDVRNARVVIRWAVGHPGG